jgi:hypothetical protein
MSGMFESGFMRRRFGQRALPSNRRRALPLAVTRTFECTTSVE